MRYLPNFGELALIFCLRHNNTRSLKSKFILLWYGGTHFDVTLGVSEYIAVCTDLIVPDIWVHTAIFQSFGVMSFAYSR